MNQTLRLAVPVHAFPSASAESPTLRLNVGTRIKRHIPYVNCPLSICWIFFETKGKHAGEVDYNVTSPQQATCASTSSEERTNRRFDYAVSNAKVHIIINNCTGN